LRCSVESLLKIVDVLLELREIGGTACSLWHDWCRLHRLLDNDGRAGGGSQHYTSQYKNQHKRAENGHDEV
jgi:hypothetical protein